MTEHYTMQEAVELARECGFDIGSGITERVHVCTTGKVHDLINTAVTRKLAEKELEVVELRDQADRDAKSIEATYKVQMKMTNKIADLTAKLAAAEDDAKTLNERDASQVLSISRLEDVIGERDEVIDTLRAQLTAAEEQVKELERVFLSSPLTSTLLPNGERVEVYTVLKTHADDAIERSE